jgi:hypothetical protein
MSETTDFFVTSSGAPLTGASGSFTTFSRSTIGAVRAAASIVEVGGGLYRVVPNSGDATVGTVIHVDCGVGRLPRRFTYACFLNTNENQFWAVHLENPDGTVWTGAAPTFGVYSSPVGARTPPTLVAVEAAYLFVAVPTSADITATVITRLNGPTGSAQPYWTSATSPYPTDPVIIYVPPTNNHPITPKSWMLLDVVGEPLTGITGTFLFYGDPVTGAARTPPTIVQRTGGLYGFTPSSADLLNGVVWVVDNGATAHPRYVAGSCYRIGAPIGVVFLLDQVGALWAGAAPNVGIYVDATGAPRAPPNLVQVPGLSYLWMYKPSWADLQAGASIRVNRPAGSVISKGFY